MKSLDNQAILNKAVSSDSFKDSIWSWEDAYNCKNRTNVTLQRSISPELSDGNYAKKHESFGKVQKMFISVINDRQ